jgi:carbon monoxide dehydrogenase subunit G
MPRASASVRVHVPISVCHGWVHGSVREERYLSAYSHVRGGKQYSGQVVESQPPQRVVIAERGYDPLSGHSSQGWAITYRFSEAGAGVTEVEVSVEYGMGLALLGLGTMGAQAQNEVLNRISALLALEHGTRAPEASS